MPEHPNAAAFRQAVADMLQGDLDRFRDLLAADVMWHEAGNAQPLRGRESVMRIFEGLISSGLEFDDDVQVVLARRRAPRGVHPGSHPQGRRRDHLSGGGVRPPP